MTTPHDFEPVIGDDRMGDTPQGRRRRAPIGGAVASVRAVALGIRDTAKDMLHAGQIEAQRAQDEAWSRYDSLTRYRRVERERAKAEEEAQERGKR